MLKTYNEEKLLVPVSEVLPKVLENVIDARFKYLKELDYENHRYARQILEEEYKPAVKLLKELMQNID
jgi:hypothetical protein